MRTLLLVTFPLALACAGLGDDPPAGAARASRASPAPPPASPAPPPASPAPPPAPDAWVNAAVAEALQWEMMPGTEGEPEPGRAEALRTFFLAHPEYADAGQRQRLAADACGLGGTEAAHAYHANPPPKTPVMVEVNGEDWKILVPHAHVHCTSDDWSWYSSEASEAAVARGAVTAYGTANHDMVVVTSRGAELARLPLTGQGFLAARAGAPPKEIAYDPSAVEDALEDYFGPRSE